MSKANQIKTNNYVSANNQNKKEISINNKNNIEDIDKLPITAHTLNFKQVVRPSIRLINHRDKETNIDFNYASSAAFEKNKNKNKDKENLSNITKEIAFVHNKLKELNFKQSRSQSPYERNKSNIKDNIDNNQIERNENDGKKLISKYNYKNKSKDKNKEFGNFKRTNNHELKTMYDDFDDILVDIDDRMDF